MKFNGMDLREHRIFRYKKLIKDNIDWEDAPSAFVQNMKKGIFLDAFEKLKNELRLETS